MGSKFFFSVSSSVVRESKDKNVTFRRLEEIISGSTFRITFPYFASFEQEGQRDVLEKLI